MLNKVVRSRSNTLPSLDLIPFAINALRSGISLSKSKAAA